MIPDASLALAGALTGLLVGMTGVGGGALMTPVLLLVFGVAPISAVGTDLWLAAITKVFAARIHHARDLIDWQVLRRLWIGSLSASALTLAWMFFHPADVASGNWIRACVGIAVSITAVGMVFQKPLHALGRRWRIADASAFKAAQGPLTVLAGAVLGVVVTLTSVGAGALGTVFLIYLYPLRLTPPRLVATDIVHAIPLALFAGIGHLLMGDVDLGLLGNLLLGSIPGVVVGARLSAWMPHPILRGILAVVLLAIGIKLWP